MPEGLSDEQLRRLARRLMRKHGAGHWRFRINARKRAVGLAAWDAGCETGTIYVSRHFARLNPKSEVIDVILHEIAHVLAGPTKPVHGDAWVEACLKVGATPEQFRRNYVMPDGRWQGQCPLCFKKFNAYNRVCTEKKWSCGPCGPAGVFSYADLGLRPKGEKDAFGTAAPGH